MSYIGKTPTPAPLTANDLSDGIITSAKISDGTVAQVDLIDQAVNEAKMQVSNSPTNGYFLSAQSGNTGGMTWAEAGGGGKVLQVVQGTKTDSTLSTSASYVATGLNVNITPSATSSKVLVMVSSYIDSNASTIQFYTTIKRDSTDLDSGGTGGFQSAYNGGGRLRSATNMSVLDSPNTTSQITYEMYMRNASGANIQINSESGTMTIIAMEIGA